MDLFIFGTREYGDIVVSRDYIDSDRKCAVTVEEQVLLMHTKIYKKSKESVASLVMIHGLGEHGGRYLGIGKAIVDETDVEIHLVDLRGYGASGGGRVMATFHELQANIASLFAKLNPDKPIFLFGHSMGGGNNH